MGAPAARIVGLVGPFHRKVPAGAEAASFGGPVKEHEPRAPSREAPAPAPSHGWTTEKLDAKRWVPYPRHVESDLLEFLCFRRRADG